MIYSEAITTINELSANAWIQIQVIESEISQREKQRKLKSLKRSLLAVSAAEIWKQFLDEESLIFDI
jgi:hypothetical protein